MDTISRITFRRYLLGQQGLWPGRRFKGLAGTTSAIQQMEGIQLDPLNIVARSQEIALYGRVLDFKPENLYQAAYEKRGFFDYGGWLFMYPMSEFPYWRLHMKHRKKQGIYYHDAYQQPPAKLLNAVLNELRTRGPLGNRDFSGEALKSWSYRGRKEESIALFYLWLIGEVMITNRKGFDRIYDLTERVLPKKYEHTVPDSEAEDFFSRKTIAHLGLARENVWRTGLAGFIHRDVSREEGKKRIERLIEQGIASRLRVEGSKDGYLVLNSEQSHLSDLEAGRIPKKWKLLDTSTQEEVTFLAPLEMVSARGRAKVVFDFEYLWEVYKPLHQRRWGYYTLPILYGDDLVARLDPKLDRQTETLHILGFWLEDDAPKDEAFASALAKGLARFARMIRAKKVDVSAVRPPKLRSYLKKNIGL
ncbi:MAG TPA: crosslink repair DNA glycosylase YcaQ family protein [Anaerolineales bacterium]|nr:crosslink repair DNA glycosylase YcaQ family protein [Anaerolineales bacterium]HMX19419.1 crosslink repair DNA glycosylase YcaQ family protein [Anaerolineales bacterium]HMZ41951.1 crosslink repair DNA glycosylase YcaQ family protein [Anaerolineales bacterium]HNA54840.1 crosslink repair DNA glycosylase YcaQ family protein [Anaerolineales bacterium]HNB85984.1 crosslink repair DNA glycosylase YcaQ family protein [Anaerolineales bacterium]